MHVARAGITKPDRLKAAALLVEKGVPLDVKSASGSTALSDAISRRDVEMVRYLLSRGAQVNGELKDGITPVAVAVMVGNREILQEIMSKGANLDVKISGLSLIEFAEKNSSPEIVEMLRSSK